MGFVLHVEVLVNAEDKYNEAQLTNLKENQNVPWNYAERALQIHRQSRRGAHLVRQLVLVVVLPGEPEHGKENVGRHLAHFAGKLADLRRERERSTNRVALARGGSVVERAAK